jgi:hypothetical protein
MANFEKSLLWQKTLAHQDHDDPYNAPRERLRSAYLKIRDRAEILAGEISKSLPEFTVHDITHLDTLWELASLITGPDYPLTPTEAFVLGGAFLIHDLGMSLAAYPDGIETLKREPLWNDIVASSFKKKFGRFPSEEELSEPDSEIQEQAIKQVLRSLHAKHAERLALIGWTDKGAATQYHLIEDVELRSLYGPIMGKIAHSHWWPVEKLGEEFRSKLGAPAGFPNEWEVAPLKLACILRIADVSHLDMSRAPSYLRILRSPPEDSKKHWIFQEKLNQPRLEDDRLVYTSNNPFLIEESPSWWLCFDALQLVDHELREVNALLMDNDLQQLAALGVAGIAEPERLTRFIPTRDWLPIDTQIKVTDVAALVHKLGGEQLYGADKTVPLRELIQNGLDAIRARRLIEGRPENWGEIIVRQSNDSKGDWIEVEDNGVGMSVDVLKGPFLDFGITLWNSELLYKEFPGLSASGFQSTGEYGIGFFSVFMWGDHVLVTTRRYDAAQRDTQVLEFTSGLDSRPLLRKAQEKEVIREGGTRVRVYLKEQRDVFEYLEFRRRQWTLQELCAWLCPSIDVDLFVEIEGKGREKVISASDWISLDGEELLKRVMIENDEGEKEELIKRAAKNLRLLINSSDKIVGRASIFKTSLFEHGRKFPSQLEGVVTVGGLRACYLTGISGILAGIPVTAARKSAIPIVEYEKLAEWASEQANFVQKIISEPEDLKECAEVIRVCLGKTEELPIAFCGKEWLSASGISKWKNPPGEIILVQDAAVHILQRDFDELILHENVLAIAMGIPGILQTDFPNRSGLYWPEISRSEGKFPQWDFHCQTLVGAVVEALAVAWSVSVDEILTVSDFSSDKARFEREIGLGDGRPVIETVDIIRNPRCSKSV